MLPCYSRNRRKRQVSQHLGLPRAECPLLRHRLAQTWPGGLSVMSLCLSELISEVRSVGCRRGCEVLAEVLGYLLSRSAVASIELSPPGKLTGEAVNINALCFPGSVPDLDVFFLLNTQQRKDITRKTTLPATSIIFWICMSARSRSARAGHMSKI